MVREVARHRAKASARDTLAIEEMKIFVVDLENHAFLFEESQFEVTRPVGITGFMQDLIGAAD